MCAQADPGHASELFAGISTAHTLWLIKKAHADKFLRIEETDITQTATKLREHP